MEQQLTIYNTLNRKKELFVPLHAPHVGMSADRPFTVMPTWATHVLPLLSIYFSAILHTLAIKCAMSAILPM